jgi:hypothetical protein
MPSGVLNPSAHPAVSWKVVHTSATSPNPRNCPYPSEISEMPKTSETPEWNGLNNLSCSKVISACKKCYSAATFMPFPQPLGNTSLYCEVPHQLKIASPTAAMPRSVQHHITSAEFAMKL